MNEQLLHLDISKRPDASQTVRIGQGDVHGTTIVAEIFDNDVALDLSGKTARFLMRQPGGHDYVRDTNCTVSGNRVTYVVDESHVGTAAGYTDTAYFEILSGSTTIASTQRFRIEILRHAMDGATPAQSWDTEIDELIERGEQAVSDAEQAVDDATNAVDAANQAIARIEPTIEQAAEDAAEQATADAEQRIQDAIDAMGDISELAVPLMSPDVRGGAKLEQHGGLALRDGALGIGSLVQQSDGYARGGLAEVTAKGHAEQVATTGKNLLDLSTPLGAGRINSYSYSEPTLTLVAGTSGSPWILYPIGSVSELVGTTLTLSIGSFSSQKSSGAAHLFYYDSSQYGNGGIAESTQSPSDYSPRTITVRNATKSRFNLDMLGFLVYADSNPATAPANTVELSNIQLELGSTATSYEPYTGGVPGPNPDHPFPIEVVSGRNLLDFNNFADGKSKTTLGGITYAVMSDGGIHVYGTSTSNDTYFNIANPSSMLQLTAGETYTLSKSDGTGTNLVNVSLAKRTGSTSTYLFSLETTYSTAFTAESVDGYTCYLQVKSGKTVDVTLYPQLTLGSTPQPYVPYGHVGMEARDPDTDELISCTALPLPQRGWVAGLRDGTADSLRLDGAGKCEWTLSTSEVVLDGTVNAVTYNSTGSMFQKQLNDMKAQSAQNILFNGLSNRYIGTTSTGEANWSNKSSGVIGTRGTTRWLCIKDTSYDNASDYNTWLSTHNVTVLYPLATPVTEDCGYVDMPAIPSDATVTIPELDELGISYFVDDTVTQYGREIYARVRSEYADRITALEQAVAELATS